MLVGEGGVAVCCFVKVTHRPYNGRDRSIPFAAPLARRSWDRHKLSARLLLPGGYTRPRQGGNQKPVGPAL